ncbi:hypothetical protein AB0K92_16055 [Streptomyces sp. NPDC052687]|uniref:hypothetical protein n=1 Tax=Streptomyces sp. NPDC052687 TaxID=3154759 RepID=UPI00342F6463
MFDFCPGDCMEPVDEEAELFEELWSMEYRICGDQSKAKAYARNFLDRHAHVLAEKIRNSDRLRDYTDDHMGDCNMAADEIDPEVP